MQRIVSYLNKTFFIAIVFISIAFSFFLPLKAKTQKTKPIYAAIAVDYETGRILYQQNADLITPPASLTKLMTLLMLFDALEQGKIRLTDMIPVSKHAASQQPCKIGLRPGSYISVQNIILALVTKSANDAASVAGEFLGGTEAAFANYMTRRAQQFGMLNTTFKNASGWPASGQLTTARDMAILGLVTLKHYQKYFHLFGVREFCYNKVCHINHNYRLLSQKHIKFDGIKTGYVNASGFNVIASQKDDNGKRLIIVVMGGCSPAWRDKRVVEIAQRLKTSPSRLYIAQSKQPQPKAIQQKVTELSKQTIQTTLTTPTSPQDIIAQKIEQHVTASPENYTILLGYYGSQLRAETIAKQAIVQTQLGQDKLIETRKVRIGGRNLYQSSINKLSKEEAEQATSVLRYFNIDSSIVQQPS